MVSPSETHGVSVHVQGLGIAVVENSASPHAIMGHFAAVDRSSELKQARDEPEVNENVLKDKRGI